MSKECTNCGRFILRGFGDNFCTKCGAELMEIKEEQYQCSNSFCSMHKNGQIFMKHQQYCGECGSKLILMPEGVANHE